MAALVLKPVGWNGLVQPAQGQVLLFFWVQPQLVELQ